MEIADLNQDERVALVGLLKLVVLSDGNVSDEEQDHIEDLIDSIGDDKYQAALETYEDSFDGNGDAFRAFLKGITRQDARELIFGTILEAAGAEAVEPGESSLLDWLSQTWNVKVEIQDQDQDQDQDQPG
jgi:hypothetical protein